MGLYNHTLCEFYLFDFYFLSAPLSKNHIIRSKFVDMSCKNEYNVRFLNLNNSWTEVPHIRLHPVVAVSSPSSLVKHSITCPVAGTQPLCQDEAVLFPFIHANDLCAHWEHTSEGPWPVTGRLMWRFLEQRVHLTQATRPY